MTIETLSRDGFALAIAPQMGGSVISFTHEGRPIFRDGRHASSAVDTSAFPLLPFASRITDGRFMFDGRAVQLALNFPPEPHALHGNGWQSAWQVAEKSQTTLTIKFNHNGTDWPWRFEAAQRFKVTPTGLQLVMSITNQDRTPMPAGLGWHPFFSTVNATVNARTDSIWLNHKPTPQTSSNDLSRLRQVGDFLVDNIYEWQARRAEIMLDNFALTMTASDIFNQLTVYTPADQPHFCVEPVSHAPDALNLSLPQSKTGLRILAPGETLAGQIDLAVAPR